MASLTYSYDENQFSRLDDRKISFQSRFILLPQNQTPDKRCSRRQCQLLTKNCSIGQQTVNKLNYSLTYNWRNWLVQKRKLDFRSRGRKTYKMLIRPRPEYIDSGDAGV